jgi:peptidoglycan/LPS O-acetylase OafA/YrhL
MGISRAVTSVRITVLIGIFLNFLLNRYWAASTFIGGMFVAEMEALFEDINYKVPDHPFARLRYYILWGGCLLFTLIVFGWPEGHPELDPWVSWLIPYTPPQFLDSQPAIHYRFWHALTATLFIWCLFRLPTLQNFFTTRFSLYLGDISYAIYIIHMHWILSLGRRMHRTTDHLFGSNRGEGGQFNLLLANCLELGVLLPVMFWEADLFWRLVDTPSVKLGKWVESKVRVSEVKKESKSPV